MPRVMLYAHRLQADTGSGVQRYTDGIISGLEGLASSDWDLAAISPGAVGDDWNGEGMPRRTIRLPRKMIHGWWSVAGFPHLEALAGRTDLVHLLSTAIPVPSRAPQVITIHDLFTIRHPEWFTSRSMRTTLRTLRRAVRGARRIIAPSSFVARDLTDTLGVEPARISVVPEGVDAHFAARASEAEHGRLLAKYDLRPQSYLVTVGLLSPRKNLRVLVEAWAMLRSRLGGGVPSLIVVGPEDVGHDRVRREADRLGHTEIMRFTGYVPDADLRALVTNAIALLHPSLDEGFGLTPLEAMAAGVPALVSNAGAIPEVTGDGAWHLDPHDAGAWADAVHKIQHDPARRASMIEAGHRRASQFTWSAAAAATLDVYRNALADG